MRRRTLLSTALSAAGAAFAGICATGLGIRRASARATYPSHALSLIVPFAPGTSVGINARLLQPHLEQALGQHVALDFVAGAGGLMGHLAGASAAADGYTLTMISASLTTQPWISRASAARPDGFAFIGQVTSFPSILMVRADSPYRTLGDLVAALHAAPESLRTGQLVGWWPPALAQAQFLLRAAIQPKVVTSYYSGSDLVVALALGQLDFAVVGLADVRPSLNSGTLRALAVSAHTPTLPATPSFREQGWDVTQGWWRGLAAPADTPDDVVGRLGAALREALDSSALQADFSHNGLTVDPLDGPEFRQFVLDEYRTLGALFTALGLNVQVAKPL